jgi:DNA-directed RNA polymerase
MREAGKTCYWRKNALLAHICTFDVLFFFCQGHMWWAQSEEPWQTLASCMEVAKAIKSGDLKSYVCHFPVHQDGSCNGLQHYAALGRDRVGAESVNLKRSVRPQDVYSCVAALVS